MAAEKSTPTGWCADCWERWGHTAWKHMDFLEWLWTSPKSAAFVQITALHAWHLNESLFPAEKPWVYGLRMTIGMCLLLGSQLGMIITFFFVKRKCYRHLNVLSGWFEGGFLVKTPLSLSLIFLCQIQVYWSTRRLETHHIFVVTGNHAKFSWFSSLNSLGRYQGYGFGGLGILTPLQIYLSARA